MNGKTILIDKRCVIKDGWDDAGKKGYVFAVHCCGIIDALNAEKPDVAWAFVKWDDEEDPTTFKLSGLEIESDVISFTPNQNITDSEYRNLVEALYPKNKKR